MKDLLDDLDRWRLTGKRVALVRVVDIEGSGPRAPGAAMAVSEDGEVSGSVSGGCVEGAVVAEALAMLDGGDRRVVTFGYSDEDAFAVGLTCGGTVHLFIEEFDGDGSAGLFDRLADHMRRGLAVALATVVAVTETGTAAGPRVGAKLVVQPGAEPTGSLGHPDLDRVAARDALGQLEVGVDEIRHYGPEGEAREHDVTVFIESFAPPPRLVVFGAVDFTGALLRAGKLLGYHVAVVDAREVFATRHRFPMADEVVVDWPNRYLERLEADGEVPSLGPRDAVCIMTHDAKFDVPAVLASLQTDVGYIGAMGSRRTHDAREKRLREEGLGDGELARLHSPIGLDLGARTPEEVAVAIMAEIIATHTGRSVPKLRETTGPLH